MPSPFFFFLMFLRKKTVLFEISQELSVLSTHTFVNSACCVSAWWPSELVASEELSEKAIPSCC